jgi:hypothetical protein
MQQNIRPDQAKLGSGRRSGIVVLDIEARLFVGNY